MLPIRISTFVPLNVIRAQYKKVPRQDMHSKVSQIDSENSNSMWLSSVSPSKHQNITLKQAIIVSSQIFIMVISHLLHRYVPYIVERVQLNNRRIMPLILTYSQQSSTQPGKSQVSRVITCQPCMRIIRFESRSGYQVYGLDFVIFLRHCKRTASCTIFRIRAHLSIGLQIRQ